MARICSFAACACALSAQALEMGRMRRCTGFAVVWSKPLQCMARGTIITMHGKLCTSPSLTFDGDEPFICELLSTGICKLSSTSICELLSTGICELLSSGMRAEAFLCLCACAHAH